MNLFSPNMSMSEAVAEHPSLIPLLNRFGIRLGLGDKTVKEVCDEHHLDTDFVLTVINTYLHEAYFPEKKLQTFHTSQIVDYLTKTNNYYLRFQLPNIERHLGSFIAMGAPDNPTLQLIGKFFASFKEELTARIHNDESQYFPYCLSLSERCTNPADTGEWHLPTGLPEADDPIQALLYDLKNIMVKHLSGAYDDNLCYAVIFTFTSLEKDIRQHNRIRYYILAPLIAAMEAQLNIQKTGK